MTDKELIRKEIIRLKNEQLSIFSKGENDEICGTALTCIGVYNQLLSFTDSLPEESGCEANFTTKSEDLEEYAKKLAKGAALDKHNLIWMCKKGAEWQKQKDLEDAVEGISCTYSNKSGTFLHIKNGLDTKDGDKVKIIIVKED